MSEYSAYSSHRHNSKNSRPDRTLSPKDEEAGFTTVYNLDLAVPQSDTNVSTSSATDFSSHHTPCHDENKWMLLRLKVMRMATVKRLQLLWGLLALFGTMAWLALMPAYAFRYDHLLSIHLLLSVVIVIIVITIHPPSIQTKKKKNPHLCISPWDPPSLVVFHLFLMCRTHAIHTMDAWYDHVPHRTTKPSQQHTPGATA